MEEIVLLEGVLDKTGDVLAGVGDDQAHLPTPCDEYDVEALVNHIVGWVQAFDAGSNGRPVEGDPSTYEAGDDPAAEFRRAADGIVRGWRENGIDRPVRISSGDEQPGEMVFNMTVMEYLTHGWDLATATGQPIPFTDDEAGEVLTRAKATLPPQYQGPGMPFGAPVDVPDDAAAIDQVIGFMGRDPNL